MENEISISPVLRSLIEAVVCQAQKEGLTITELNSVISEIRKNAGMVRQYPQVKCSCREPSAEDKAFEEKVYAFFLEQFTEEAGVPSFVLERNAPIKIRQLSQITTVAKMIVADGGELKNPVIRDYIWLWDEGTNFRTSRGGYSDLVRRIGFAIKKLGDITSSLGLHSKEWAGYYVYENSQSRIILTRLLLFLEKQGIQ